MTDLLKIIVGGVATWRLSHLFLYENGPFRVFRRIRIRLGVAYHHSEENYVVSYKYELTTCIWCLSMWVGTAVTLLLRWSSWGVWLLLPPTLSAVTVFMHKHIGKG